MDVSRADTSTNLPANGVREHIYEPFLEGFWVWFVGFFLQFFNFSVALSMQSSKIQPRTSTMLILQVHANLQTNRSSSAPT